MRKREGRGGGRRMIRRAARWTATALLTGVIVFCGWRIWGITGQYRQEAAMHGELLAYKPEGATVESMQSSATDASGTLPDTSDTPDSAKDTPPSTDKARVNQGILDLRERNTDVIGWISVPGTDIDYPFVQAEDNSYYLHRDIDGKYAAAGTIFMDYRCNSQLLSFNTLLFGHNMKNGSMFGTLRRFDGTEFFEEHPTATLYLDYKTYTLEIFAYMVVTSNNAMIYETLNVDEPAQAQYFAYVAENARQYRDIGLTPGDRIVTLSTCSYAFDDARMVLLARMLE